MNTFDVIIRLCFLILFILDEVILMKLPSISRIKYI